MWQLLNKDLRMSVGPAAQRSSWASVFLTQKLVFGELFHFCVASKTEKYFLCCFCWWQIELEDVFSADWVTGDVALNNFLWLIQFLQYKCFVEKLIALDIKKEYSDWIPEVVSLAAEVNLFIYGIIYWISFNGSSGNKHKIKRNVTNRLNFRKSKNFTLATTVLLLGTVVLLPILNVFLNFMTIFKREVNFLRE